MPPLRISIVTPSFNQSRFIRRTIDSVLGQQGEFVLDYRVLDGASTDGTIDVLKSYGARLNWVSGPDGGQIEALNRGLRESTGEVVGWVNSDDVLLPGALARVAAAFRDHPDALWIHGRCRIIDEDDREIRRWLSSYKHIRALRHSFEALLTENYISQMTTFWRRSAHDQLGYFDLRWPLAFDYDFFLRLAAQADPVYVREPLACFRWYRSSKSGSGHGRQFLESSAIAAKYQCSAFATARRKLKNLTFQQVYRVMGHLSQRH
jgi:glycosyltransferase involved in cell wall biosynthesis